MGSTAHAGGAPGVVHRWASAPDRWASATADGRRLPATATASGVGNAMAEAVAPTKHLRRVERRKNVTCTLTRVDGCTLGLAIDGNHVEEVKVGGLAAREGTIQPGDLIVEVNGKSTSTQDFVKLLPADKTKPIKLRLMRFVEVYDV